MFVAEDSDFSFSAEAVKHSDVLLRSPAMTSSTADDRPPAARVRIPFSRDAVQLWNDVVTHSQALTDDLKLEKKLELIQVRLSYIVRCSNTRASNLADTQMACSAARK